MSLGLTSLGPLGLLGFLLHRCGPYGPPILRMREMLSVLTKVAEPATMGPWILSPRAFVPAPWSPPHPQVPWPP